MTVHCTRSKWTISSGRPVGRASLARSVVSEALVDHAGAGEAFVCLEAIRRRYRSLLNLREGVGFCHALRRYSCYRRNDGAERVGQ